MNWRLSKRQRQKDAMRLSLGTRFCFAFVLTFFAASLAPAQSTFGDIAGTVSDVSGAAIPVAQVTLVNTDTGVSTTTMTKDGTYRFQALPPAHYQIAVMADGFSSKTVTNATLQLGSHLPEE